ncbi:MAG: YiiD C-terminal domain-containing protein [Actinomycetota bacterium]
MDDTILGIAPDQLASSVEQIMRTSVPLMGDIGIEVVEAERRHVRTRLPWNPRNGNHIGTVYAGVLFSFLESTGGAIVLVSFDVTKWIPVVVEATIRYARPVTAAVDCDMRLTEDEVDAVHDALAKDPKYRWTFTATAVAEDGRTACEADLVYRFRAVPG